MAEGWTRALKGGLIEPYSAGVKNSQLDPRAVQVMGEAGVDISTHRSKTSEEFSGMMFDYVVTVCDSARESCPSFPGSAETFHIGFDDPPRLAQSAQTDEEALNHYRRVRDEIRAFVESLPDVLAMRKTKVDD